MKDAIIAVAVGAGMFVLNLAGDAYASRHWPSWGRTAADLALSAATVFVVTAASNRPWFALVGIAIVVVVWRVAPHVPVPMRFDRRRLRRD